MFLRHIDHFLRSARTVIGIQECRSDSGKNLPLLPANAGAPGAPERKLDRGRRHRSVWAKDGTIIGIGPTVIRPHASHHRQPGGGGSSPSARDRWLSAAEARYRVVMGMSDMPNPRYDQARRSVQALEPADQLRLIAELIGRLSGELDRQPRRSLLELQGLGKGLWHGLDVDEYLRRERSSWNG